MVRFVVLKAMKKLPKQIKILGKTYLVREVKSLADFGSTDFFNQDILIREDMSVDNKESVILHEVLEVINDSLDLNLTHQTLQSLEASLFQVYKDN